MIQCNVKKKKRDKLSKSKLLMSLSVIVQYNSGIVPGNQSKKDARSPKKHFDFNQLMYTFKIMDTMKNIKTK